MAEKQTICLWYLISFFSKTSPNNSGTFPLTLTLDVAGQGLSIFQDSVNGWQQGQPAGDNMPQQVAFLHLHKLTEFLQLCCSACWYAETARFLRPAALRNLRSWIDVFSEIIRISCEHGNIRLRRPDRHASEHSSWYSEEKSMSHSFPANMITSRYAGITETHPCTAANLLSDFFAYLLLPVFSNCLSKVFKTSPVSSKHYTQLAQPHTQLTHIRPFAQWNTQQIHKK